MKKKNRAYYVMTLNEIILKLLNYIKKIKFIFNFRLLYYVILLLGFCLNQH